MSIEPTIWINGEFLSEKEAGFSFSDHGFTAGDGCYETMVTYYLTPVAFPRHYVRLQDSLQRIGISGIPDEQDLFKAVKQLVIMNKLIDPVCVRVTVTAGRAPLGVERGRGSTNTVICAEPAPKPGEECHVVFSPYERCLKSATLGLNTLSNMENVMALRYAQERNAGEVIFTNNEGMICDGSYSSIFWVDDGIICTPALSTGARADVMRELMIELCGRLDFPIREVEASIDNLTKVKEAFLASSLREIQPVVSIDGRRLLPGVLTVSIRKAYREYVEGELDF